MPDEVSTKGMNPKVSLPCMYSSEYLCNILQRNAERPNLGYYLDWRNLGTKVKMCE